MSKDQPILVIGDDTFDPATTGQTMGTVGPATTGQTTPTATSVEGEHWQRLPVRAEGGGVASLALDPGDPSVLYAGTQEGLFRSTDAAGSWEQILSLGSGRYYVGIDPTSPATVYALWVAPVSPEPIKMMRSDDGGSTWTDLSETEVVLAARQEYAQTGGWGSSLEVFVFDTSTDPTTVYLGVSSRSKEAPDKTVIRLNYWGSSDKGESWTKLDQEEQDQLESTIESPNPALSEFGGKNLSDADGRVIGWVASAAVTSDPQDPSIIYAGTDAGVCKSTDGGETWTKASRGLPGSLVGGKLIIDPNAPSTLYVAAKEGVFKSHDGGATWDMILPVGYMEEGNRMCSLAMAPSATSTLYALTSDGLFRSDDGGETWTGLAGEGLYPQGSKPESFNMSSELVLVAADDPDTLFAVRDDLLRSTDGGNTWTVVLPQPGASFDGYSVRADSNGASVMYATTWTLGGPEVGYLYSVVRSTDKGATWTAIVPERPESTFYIALDASDPAGIYTIEYARPSVVSRSLDGGATWENVDFGGLTGSIRQLVFDPRSPETLYALVDQSTDPAVVDLGVFRSTDGGATWMSVLEGLPSGSLTLAVDPTSIGTLYAFGGSGVYKWVPGE
ncbi:MAG: hypothetical protein JXA87_11620 [Thermoleophilia bacterium]|nr:hypothetical protein [Thermoleophilia bacterium]